MKTDFKKHLLLNAGIALTVVVLAACDSGDDSANGDTTPVEQVEDFDLDALHTQIGDIREPGPSLGFALPPNGRIYSRTGSVGAAVGTEFEIACTGGKVLAGVSGHYSNRLDRIQAICVTANSSGNWTDNPATVQTSAGSNNGQPFSRVCQSGHAVVGFTSDLASQHPAYLQLHCRKLNGEQTTIGERASLNTIGTLGSNAPTSRPQCADRAAATGFYGYAQSAIERMGLVCYEDPAFAGRWSSRIDWPHIAIHSVMLSDGKLLTYGTGGSGIQGAMEYNVWDPTLGIGQTSHKNIQGNAQVDSFCSAASLLPDTGNVLIPGGDARPLGRNNVGIRDATLFDAVTQTVSGANDMNHERWYPTSTTLPSGDILVSAGRDGDAVFTETPEVYSTANGTWRLLNNASMSAYQFFYPRQFVIPNGKVFGVSGRAMYIMSTDGNGSINDVGQLPGHSFGTSATAAMFEPGKIIHAGGFSNHGIGAVVIDVTSGTPSVSRTEDLAQPRRAWATTVLLADGKVMMVGGSYEVNDDITASHGTEVWDPDTGKWIQYSRHELSRLYHSTATLLMDGRVLLAGGGSPGPLNNRNGEIFSPPYLYDKNGTLADRPIVSYAPDKATWGQSVDIRTGNNGDIEKITLVKTGSTTHGFNMDQRFLELDFALNANALSVTMPASGNVAPPGYYMMFAHNANGTPSHAHMVQLGVDAAPPAPPVNPNPQLPPLSANTLLTNGGFEAGKQAWFDCAATDKTAASSTSVEGRTGMKVNTGGCLYQTVSVQPGTNYSLNCHSRGGPLEYSSLSLQMLDANYAELTSASVVVESADFEQQPISLTAPVNSFYGSVTLYSEGTAYFDRCELIQEGTPTTTPPTEPPASPDNSLISNGDFENGKTNWTDCSRPELTGTTSDSANGAIAMQVQNAGCIYQEFPLTPGKTYELSCLSKSAATNYSSLSLTLMNESYTTLASDHKPIGRDFFQSYKAQLFTPFDGRIGAVTLYSEDTAQFDDCSVVEI